MSREEACNGFNGWNQHEDVPMVLNRKYRALQNIEYEGARHIEESSFFHFLTL